MIKNILLVGLGGFIGSIARYLVYVLIDQKKGLAFPVSTFTVNILGSLVLGFIIGIYLKGTGFTDQHKLVFAVGFCGSFTTFSTFALENFELLQAKPLSAIFYTIVSLSVGLLAVWAGTSLARLW